MFIKYFEFMAIITLLSFTGWFDILLFYDAQKESLHITFHQKSGDGGLDKVMSFWWPLLRLLK